MWIKYGRKDVAGWRWERKESWKTLHVYILIIIPTGIVKKLYFRGV